MSCFSILINATCVGERPDGIGVYTRQMTQTLAARWPEQRLIVYVNHRAYWPEIDRYPNVELRRVSGCLSPDYGFSGHLLRLLFSQLLAARFPRTLIFNPSQLEVALRHRCQAVTIHDLIPLLFPRQHRQQHLFYKYLLGSALRRARAVIAPSKHTRKLLLAHYRLSPERVQAIHNGVSGTGQEIKPAISEKEPFILYLGRLSATKNVAGLIRAYRRVAPRIPHRLVIAGGGPNEQLRAGDPGGVGTVEFRGYVSAAQARDLLRRAALFVFPSLYEGFGFPPLEAMTCSCPVVVANTASLPEVCGPAAWYVNPSDSDSIADGILRVLSDEKLRQRLIADGLAWSRRFTWERSAAAHQRLFRELSAGPKETAA